MHLPRIYLAGPDVFFPHAQESYAQLEVLCAQHGLCGVRPADGTKTYQGVPGTTAHAQAIYSENLERISSCHGVLANLRAFRNAVEPDSGTVFEVGYAVAKGLPVVGVIEDVSVTMEDKVCTHFGRGQVREGLPYDATYDYLIETFGMPLNLMLGCSTPLFSCPDQALRALAHLISKG